jgi:hypothetical protein
MRIETAISAETLIPIFQTTRCHREGYNTNIQHRGGIKQQTMGLKQKIRKLRELTFFVSLMNFGKQLNNILFRIMVS